MPDRYVTEAGAIAAREMFGADGPERIEASGRYYEQHVDPSWAKIFTDFVINGMYARGILPTATRELCAVAALTVLGRSEELGHHIRIALKSNSPEHVREVILQMTVYGGAPVMFEGMRAFDRVMAEVSGSPSGSP